VGTDGGAAISVGGGVSAFAGGADVIDAGAEMVDGADGARVAAGSVCAHATGRTAHSMNPKNALTR